MAIAPVLSAADHRNHLIGIGLLTFSTFVFGFSNVLAKYLTTEYPIGEALLIRSGFALLLLLPFIKVRDLAAEARTSLWLHLLRMVLSAVEIACFYWAVANMQLADVTTFYLSTPIMLTAMGALVLHERVDRGTWIATLMGFAGVIIALRPSTQALSWPALVALGGSFLYAIFLLITRRLRRAPSSVLVMLQLSALAICGVVTIPFEWTPPTLHGFTLMAVVGIFGIIGYFCVNRALQLAPASVVAPFQYLSIIWSIALGYLAFNDIPEPATIAGAALIIVAGGFILYRERRILYRERQILHRE